MTWLVLLTIFLIALALVLAIRLNLWYYAIPKADRMRAEEEIRRELEL